MEKLSPEEMLKVMMESITAIENLMRKKGWTECIQPTLPYQLFKRDGSHRVRVPGEKPGCFNSIANDTDWVRKYYGAPKDERARGFATIEKARRKLELDRD